MPVRAANSGDDSPSRLEPAFYERLFDGAGLAIFACDLDGRILACNDIGHGMLRDVAAGDGALAIESLLPPADRDLWRQNLQTCVASLEPTEFRTRLVTAESAGAEYALWTEPVLDANGRLEALSVWFHDITARIQVRRSMRKAERLNTLGTLSGAVAHHYNNLLCSIATSLEFALNMNTMPAMRRALQRTAEAASRASQLTHQLLAFAQADHRFADQADLTEVVLFFVDQHEARMASLNITIQAHCERIPIMAVAREPMLIVLNNLVANAAEAMPSGGTLQVSLSRKDADHALLSIIDGGAGIRPEHMEHLFEPFFTTKGELGEGATRQAGMGLAVAHGLVSEMHGSISASNQPGGGARFDVVLPMRPPD
ncbi:MAG: ATP-binding protein [Phycisphaerae bacterium]